MRKNNKYIFSWQSIFLRSYKFRFLIKQFLKNVACVDYKMLCNFIAVTFSHISFPDSYQFDDSASFSSCVTSALTSLKHVKKSERKFFFRLKYGLFHQKVCLVSWSAQRKSEFLQKSKMCTKICFSTSNWNKMLFTDELTCFQEAFILLSNA